MYVACHNHFAIRVIDLKVGAYPLPRPAIPLPLSAARTAPVGQYPPCTPPPLSPPLCPSDSTLPLCPNRIIVACESTLLAADRQNDSATDCRPPL
jgi:hypothetical protein